MARACSGGFIHQCTCSNPPNDPPNGNFKWGGCSDNIRWGMHFAKRFIDNIEKNSKSVVIENAQERKLRKLRGHIASINLHNNRVGRRVRNRIFNL